MCVPLGGASLGSRRGGQLADGSRCAFDRAGAVGPPSGVVQGRGSVQQADTRYVGTLVRGSRAPSVPLVVAQHGKRRSKMVNHRRMAKPQRRALFRVSYVVGAAGLEPTTSAV